MAEPLNEETVPSEASAPEQASTEAPESTDPFDSGSDTFDRAYVEKLRQESASYRTKAKPYEETFGSYSDEDREVWFEAARRFAADPRDGGEYLKQIADAVLAEYQAEQDEANAPITDDQDRPLTMAQYTALREAERVKAEQEAEVARIEKQAAALGYDTTSEEYTYLLTVASRLPDGDLDKAHAKIQAAEEARFQARLAKMQAEAEEAPTAPNPAAGAAPGTERQLREWKDAERAARARLEAAQVGDPSSRRRR